MLAIMHVIESPTNESFKTYNENNPAQIIEEFSDQTGQKKISHDIYVHFTNKTKPPKISKLQKS